MGEEDKEKAQWQLPCGELQYGMIAHSQNKTALYGRSSRGAARPDR